MIEKLYTGGGKEEKKEKPSSGYQKGHSHKIKDLRSAANQGIKKVKRG